MTLVLRVQRDIPHRHCDNESAPGLLRVSGGKGSTIALHGRDVRARCTSCGVIDVRVKPQKFGIIERIA